MLQPTKEPRILKRNTRHLLTIHRPMTKTLSKRTTPLHTREKVSANARNRNQSTIVHSTEGLPRQFRNKGK